jgi:hypothetical protein
MPYATLAELKVFVGIPDTADDATLQVALDASEEQVNAFTGRRFTADGAAVARYYEAVNNTTVHIDPLQTTTDLAVVVDRDGDGTFEETFVLDTDYRLAPFNATAVSKPWTSMESIAGNYFPQGERRVRVTARWGYTAVPASVKQATMIQAAFLWKRKDAPYGIAGSPEFGNELRILASMDPTARDLLRPYRHTWVVV